MNKEKKKTIGNVLLKITKYTFIIFVVISLFLFVTLTIYSKNLNYYLPEVVEVEIYDREGKLLNKINNSSNRSYVRIDDINENIIKAFLSIEDKEYFNHQGVNFKRILGALWADLRNRNLSQGGSTITQQYVKNTFLDSEKTFKRKIDEALIAIHIESKYSKNEILEGYLNTIYFDHGINGIYDASMFYFNKEPKEITLNEACVLASIPKSPSNYSPIKNPENNNQRRQLILKELLEDEVITISEYNKLIDSEVTIYGKLDSAEISNAPYYQDLILKKLDDLNINLSKGIKVYTNLDSDLNKIIQDSINKYYLEDTNLELAIVAMDTKGNVLANIGGRDYLKSTFNRTNSLRQPGSTIKTFLYYSALKNGFNVASTFYSAPTTFYYEGLSYSPTNFGEIYPYQDISMAYAIATSDNIYAMKTHLYFGTDNLYNTLLDFGFNDNIKNNPSLALGASEVTLNELTLGYAKIASLGKDLKQSYISKITDLNGKVIYEQSNDFEQKFDKDTCYILSEALTNVFDNNVRINISPTCASIKQFLSSTYAAKSGSTDYDGLIVGYNKDIVLGIWTGYDNNSIVKNSDTKFIKYIWANIMENYNKGIKNTWYKTLDNIIAIKLNPINGKVAFGSEYQKYMYFNMNNLPDYLYI